MPLVFLINVILSYFLAVLLSVSIVDYVRAVCSGIQII